jgi:hypothetical protein
LIVIVAYFFLLGTRDLIVGSPLYSGTYAVLVGIYLLHLVVIIVCPIPLSSTLISNSDGPIGNKRSLWKILKDEVFLSALVPAVSVHGIMVGVMGLIPVWVKQHFGATSGNDVLTVHIVCMYAPSLLVPLVLKVISHHVAITLGFVIVGGGLIAFAWPAILALNYVSLGLIGVGWNLSFVACTALIPTVVQAPEERFRVQALNDTIVFTVGSIATLVYGALIDSVGILALTIASGVWLALALAISIIMNCLATKKKHRFLEQESLLLNHRE